MNELSTTAPEHDASPERQQRARRAANAAGESHRRRCAEADAKVAPIIRELRQQGKTLE